MTLDLETNALIAGSETPGRVSDNEIDTLVGLGLTGDVASPVRAVLLRLVAERDALEAEVARLTQRSAELELLADRDPLTPVLNRRAFMRELERAIAFCVRYKTEASLVFFDMDGFKAVNDDFGHAAGDAVLATVAQRLLDHVRTTDVVGRLGGDEFAVILVQAGPDAATQKAGALVAEIEGQPVIHKGKAIALKISAGVDGWTPETDAPQWLARADAAMFVNKGGEARR
ncbi:MAG: GGDEF domain-containing protein [Caulobacteraceae bacterium]